MKNMKKIVALLLATVMVMAMSMSVFAAGTGSITITPPEDVDADVAITYNIYKVFDADASADGTKISYKLVEGKTEAPAGFTVEATASGVRKNAGESKNAIDDGYVIRNDDGTGYSPWSGVKKVKTK